MTENKVERDNAAVKNRLLRKIAHDHAAAMISRFKSAGVIRMGK